MFRATRHTCRHLSPTNPPENLDFLRPLSRSLKIIGTDTDRPATYDFLLVLRNYYGPVSYRF